MIGLEIILGGILAAVVAVAAAWFGGQQRGKATEKRKREAANAERMRERKHVEEQVDAMDYPTARGRMDEWVRRNDGR